MESEPDELCETAGTQANVGGEKMSQAQLEHAMAERLDEYLRANGKQFVVAMITSMASGLTEHVVELATAHKATEVKLERRPRIQERNAPLMLRTTASSAKQAACWAALRNAELGHAWEPSRLL